MKVSELMLLLTMVATIGEGAVAAGDPQRQVRRGSDAASGLPSWRWEGEGIALTLAQRAPDQTRSFFEARGFDPIAADVFAEACVFKTIFEHLDASDTKTSVAYDLRDWRTIVAGERRALVLKDEWDRRWQEQGVSRKGRIAFRWALLPTQQRYAPGDHNWGMTSYGLPAGHRFDLEFVWRRDGERRAGRIEGLECAADVKVGGG